MGRIFHCMRSLSPVAALLLCSCVEDNHPYPADWAAPVRASGCDSVAGVYAEKGDFGELKPGASGAPMLFFALVPVPDNPKDGGERMREGEATDRVEIAGETQGTLVIRFRNAKQVTATLRFSQTDGSLRCGEDGVVVNRYSGMTRGRSNPLAGYEHSQIVLSKAADGALIVRQDDSAYGLVFMFLPAGGSGTSWERFPALADIP